MIRPILMASAFALAAPAMAQNTTVDDMSNTETQAAAGAMQDHSGHDMTPAQAPTVAADTMTETEATATTDTGVTAKTGTMADTSVSTSPDPMADAGKTDVKGQTGTAGQASTSYSTTGSQADTMGTTSGSAATQTGTTASWSGTSSPAMAAASGQTVQPGNNNPEQDARGIAVISAPALVPAGWNGIGGSAVGGPVADPATGEAVGAENHPACSATVTDNCLQTYERGRS